MAIHNIKLLGRQEIATNTMTFTFEKPQGFAFKAGQHANLVIMNPDEDDEEGNTRLFTFATPPYEDNLMIATRMRDTAFKRILKKIPLGAELMLDGPMGSFTLHEDENIPAVYLAGGIGITPFRSILLQAAKDKLPHKLLLFYSNYKPEDAAFLKELMAFESENLNYQFIGTMTEMNKSNIPWQGETDYINKDMLMKYISDLTKPIYYIAGPESLVTGLCNMLKGAGVRDDHICTEEFSGY
jgi:ferredoxin-NADP reductase